MQLYETVTHVGTGYYDGPITKEMVTVYRVQAYRFQVGETHETWYELRQRLPNGMLWSSNLIGTETKRDEMVQNLQPALSSLQHIEVPFVLDAVVRLPLTGFSLTETGIHFRFGTETWNVHLVEVAMMPIVTIEKGTFNPHDWGYADAIRALLGQSVAYADEYADVGIVFDFEKGESITISLDVQIEERAKLVVRYKGPNHRSYLWKQKGYEFDY
jgi:hypothetical protein